MGNLLMWIGFIFLLFGLPAAIVLTIIAFVKKWRLIFKLLVPITINVIIFFLVFGAILSPATEVATQEPTKIEQQEEKKENNKETKVEKEETPTKKEEPKQEEPIQKEEPKAEKPQKETPKKEEPKKEEPKTETPKKEEPKQEAPKENEKKEEAKEEKIQFDYDGVLVTYKEYEITSSGEIIVYFEMKNDSTETRSFDYTFDTYAWQNGIELETNYFYDCDEERNGGKEIKPGAKITVAEVYELENAKDNVVVEIRPFFSFIEETLYEFDIEIK